MSIKFLFLKSFSVLLQWALPHSFFPAPLLNLHFGDNAGAGFDICAEILDGSAAFGSGVCAAAFFNFCIGVHEAPGDTEMVMDLFGVIVPLADKPDDGNSGRGFQVTIAFGEGPPVCV